MRRHPRLGDVYKRQPVKASAAASAAARALVCARISLLLCALWWTWAASMSMILCKEFAQVNRGKIVQHLVRIVQRLRPARARIVHQSAPAKTPHEPEGSPLTCKDAQNPRTARIVHHFPPRLPPPVTPAYREGGTSISKCLFYGPYAGDLELLWVLCNIPIRSKGL